MTEEVQTPVSENPGNDTPTVETTTTETPDTLLGIQTEPKPEPTPEEIEATKYPQGFNAETWDLTTNSIKQDAVAEKFKTSSTERESLEKQVKDLRRIVSKGKAPEDVAEYSEYKPDEKYDGYYDFENEANPEVQEIVGLLDEKSKELGFNVEQNKQMKDLLNIAMEKAGVFDSRTPEQRKLEEADWRRNEKTKLGENADHIIEQSKNFIEQNNLFNEEEKKILLGLSNQGADFINIMYKFKKMFKGTGEIPTPNVATTGLADDMTLAMEYNAAGTTPQRRMQIMEQRRSSGRAGGLPMV